MTSPTLTVIIVSFNTAALTVECLTYLYKYSEGISKEVIVIDNASKDGSQEIIRKQFPEANLIESKVNLGFAAANNLGFRLARGRYIVLLNSDTFLYPDTLQNSIKHMENNPLIGLGGAVLKSRDGSWQPSARMFPSLFNDFLHLSGLASKYPHSRLFGRADATWSDPSVSRQCDWVPGAFAIVRKEVLRKVNYFDERFFLYSEEVDLCYRIKKQGYSIWCWADVIVVHLGGESSKTCNHLSLSPSGKQLTLWRMRSQLLYYRKQSGFLKAWLSAQLEINWNRLRIWKNRWIGNPEAEDKIQESKLLISLMQQAWKETKGGRYSPPTPW